ncbi:hypothetical protein Moror_6729 [Moniliophthora roreri MCA 2997]|uniref:DUF6534 domain-containing protein n=1 Tax=Moniliophthora roreri (strain MCA 2997) TaxID=1381753 RepID=V2XSI7_MONRO|nr:hypothetical protein Moror_6729 [Moniliophthora roreri MCA 2997]
MIHTLMGSPAEIAHGPMFVGFLFNMFLFGIVTLQVYNYLVTFSNDRLWLKIFVVSLYVANILNTVFIAVYLYNSLIANFGDVQNLFVANWVFATDPVLTGIIAAMAQLFFAWRVRIVTSSNWLGLLVVACTLVGLAGAVASMAGVLHHPRFIEFRIFKASVLVWLMGGCVADIAIALILVEYLWVGTNCLELCITLLKLDTQRKHKTGFHSSDQLVDRIIRMTVQTGLTTSVCAIVDLVFFLVNPTGLHLIFNFPLAKLYTVSLMSSLNSRAVISKGEPHELPLSGSSGSHRPKPTKLERPEVFIEVENHSEFEDVTVDGNEDRAKFVDGDEKLEVKGGD